MGVPAREINASSADHVKNHASDSVFRDVVRLYNLSDVLPVALDNTVEKKPASKHDFAYWRLVFASPARFGTSL